MNFETAFEKYKNGTATEEEKAYVENEIAKARKLNEFIDEMDSKRVVEPAKHGEVKAVIHKLKKKSWIRATVISVAVVIVLALIAGGSVLIYVNSRASSTAEYSKSECIELAKQSVIELTNGKAEELSVTDTEKELYFEYGRLSSAIYIYEVEIRSGFIEYEVTVNSASGKAVVVDMDN